MAFSSPQSPFTQLVWVLFLCTQNSARSQMANELLRARGVDPYAVFRAGTYPIEVHPLAIRVMRELGIDLSKHWSKGIDTFADQPPMDLVVTVCDEAAEACPIFPRAHAQAHWGFPDPSQVTGTEQVRLAAFRYIHDLLAFYPADSPEPFSTDARAVTQKR